MNNIKNHNQIIKTATNDFQSPVSLENQLSTKLELDKKYT